MVKAEKPGIRQVLRTLELSTPLTRAFYNWRYHQRLKANAIEHARSHNADAIFYKESVDIVKNDRIVRINRKHAIYSGAIAEEFDRYFGAVQPTQEGGRAVVDYSTQKVHRLLDGLEFEFASFPEQSSVIDEYFEWYTPGSGETVFDVGANVGVASYRLSKLVGPAGRVISFEPDPVSLPVLRNNIERHKLSNVTIVSSAMAEQDGSAEFCSEGTIDSTMREYIQRDTVGETVVVPVLSFKTACETYGVPAFCKIDIEGAELGLLKGAIDILSSHKIHFALDTGHIVNGEYTSKRVEDAFKSAGYFSETRTTPCGITTYARPA